MYIQKEEKPLRTITTDSMQGQNDPKFDRIVKNFMEDVQPAFNRFVNECVRKNVEYCSIDGAIYNSIFQLILNARLQAMLDLCEEGVVLKEKRS